MRIEAVRALESMDGDETALVLRLKDELGDGSTLPARFGDWAHVLFDQALLAEGGQLEDPAGYVQRVTRLLAPAA